MPFLFAFFMLLTPLALADTHFHINEGSKNYTAELSVKCQEGECSGTGTVRLFSKQNGKLFQTLQSDNLFFYLPESQNPTVNVVQLYGEQSALIFDDFNFDGYEDLAIRNGNNSGYGGPSYDVYVYNKTKKKFVISKELTDLALGNLGMFYVDKDKKQLTTYAKSGCCWHIQTKYEVVPGKGLLKVYELEEDATKDEYVEITTRKLVKGKWTIQTDKKLMKEYYGE